MLSVLPPLYPDELLYSLYARYKRWLGYDTDSDVFADLFCEVGRCRSRLASIDHDHADLLFKSLPITWVGSHEIIITDYTTRRYLTAFEFHRDPDGDVIDAEFSTYSKIRRLLRNGVVRPTVLGYCTECLVSDCCQYGEPYWHRSHQLRGVFVCSKHGVFLEYLQIQRCGIGVELALPPWPDPEKLQQSEPVDFLNPEHQLLMRIATDSSWLLRHGLGRTQQDSILLFYAVARQRPYVHRIYDPMFRATFSREFLTAVGLYARNWRHNTVGKTWCSFDTSTLAHILVFYALGLDFRVVFLEEALGTVLKHLSIQRSRWVLDSSSHGLGKRQPLPIESIVGLGVNSQLCLCSAVKRRFANLNIQLSEICT